MKNKNKIYFILYSIAQVIFGVLSFINAKVLAKTQLDAMFATLPDEVKASLEGVFNADSLTSGFRLSALVLIALSLIFFILVLRNKVGTKKGLCLGLVIASVFFSNYTIGTILTIVAIVLVATTKKEVVDKEENKPLERLDDIKLTKKDYILAIVLVLVYCIQFLPIDKFITSFGMFVAYEAVFRVTMLVLTYLAFKSRLKRDVKEFKNNFSKYIGFAFKSWAIMLGLALVVAAIKTILGVNIISENQVGLNSLNIFYTVPLAVLWAPIVEEGLFRGVVRRFIKNDTLFIIVSAVLFGLIHTITSEVTLFNIIIQSLQYAVMGGVMAYAYKKTNNICTNWSIHFIQNSFAALFMIISSFM